MRDNIILNKSVQFSIRIINLYKYLCEQKREYVLSKQLLRSGTAIGALVSESVYAQSLRDFISKLQIAIKEANETKYWLLLLTETEFIMKSEHHSMTTDCEELIKMLTSSINTSKQKLS